MGRIIPYILWENKKCLKPPTRKWWRNVKPSRFFNVSIAWCWDCKDQRLLKDVNRPLRDFPNCRRRTSGAGLSACHGGRANVATRVQQTRPGHLSVLAVLEVPRIHPMFIIGSSALSFGAALGETSTIFRHTLRCRCRSTLIPASFPKARKRSIWPCVELANLAIESMENPWKSFVS